jgi:hypothetical protein
MRRREARLGAERQGYLIAAPARFPQLARRLQGEGACRTEDAFGFGDRIRRDMSRLPDEEREGAGFRAAACLLKFRDLTWLRSYYDEGRQHSTCLYWATSVEQIRQHAEAASIPCDRITEVVEMLPDDFR